MNNIYSKSEALCNKLFTKLLIILSIIFILLSLSLNGFDYIYFSTATFITIVVCCVSSPRGKINNSWLNMTVIVFCVSLFLRIFNAISANTFIITILATPIIGRVSTCIAIQLYYDKVIKPAHYQRKRWERDRERRNARRHWNHHSRNKNLKHNQRHF